MAAASTNIIIMTDLASSSHHSISAASKSLSFFPFSVQPFPLFQSSFVRCWSASRSVACHGLATRTDARTKLPSKGIAWKSGTDHELRLVLELANDAELSDLCNILYGRSLTSPLLKSFIDRDDPQEILLQISEPEEREDLLERLESRFLFLAGDAKATLRRLRPSYRDVLLQVRKKLRVPCSARLSTEDMEAEIFLHLLQQHSCKPKQRLKLISRNIRSYFSSLQNSSQGYSKWQGSLLSAIKLGSEELLSILLKGGTVLTFLKLQDMVTLKLSRQMLMEAAKYEVAKEALKQGGRAVATKLENQIALLAAKEGIARATLHYTVIKNLMAILGPVSWGTFLADLTIKAIGTDYARVISAIYMFAQIRLTRTYGWASPRNYSHQLL